MAYRQCIVALDKLVLHNSLKFRSISNYGRFFKYTKILLTNYLIINKFKTGFKLI